MKENISLIGDLHGQWSVIAHHIEKYGVTDTTFIQVGDLGAGYRPMEGDLRLFQMLHTLLEETNCELIAIRGNHDDPKWFSGEYAHLIPPTIRLLPDYTVIEHSGERWLFIGGAVSVDRIDQLKLGKKWFPGEGITFDLDRLKNIGKVDRVVTHTAPSMAPPFLKGDFVETKMRADRNLRTELDVERQYLNDVYDVLSSDSPPKHWYYGHFHKSHRYRTPDDNCQFVCLGVDEVMLVS